MAEQYEEVKALNHLYEIFEETVVELGRNRAEVMHALLDYYFDAEKEKKDGQSGKN